ncbi:MAG: hypothetical protein KF683_09620, partial [Rubrivivax sp.]|nr:hypothetical protein [Rubrivivax sp.]
MPLALGLSDGLGTTLQPFGAEAGCGCRALAPKAPPQPWQAAVACKPRRADPDLQRVKRCYARRTLERCDEAVFNGLAHEPAGQLARRRTTKLSFAFVLRGPWPRAAVVVHGGSRCVPNV